MSVGPILCWYYANVTWEWTGDLNHGTNRLAQPASALTNWVMSTSTKMDGHNPEPITLDTSDSPPSSLHQIEFQRRSVYKLFISFASECSHPSHTGTVRTRDIYQYLLKSDLVVIVTNATSVPLLTSSYLHTAPRATKRFLVHLALYFLLQHSFVRKILMHVECCHFSLILSFSPVC